MIKLIIVLLLTGCASSPEYRQYNQEDEQDLDCYNSYMGENGYCTK